MVLIASHWHEHAHCSRSQIKEQTGESDSFQQGRNKMSHTASCLNELRVLKQKTIFFVMCQKYHHGSQRTSSKVSSRQQWVGWQESDRGLTVVEQVTLDS